MSRRESKSAPVTGSSNVGTHLASMLASYGTDHFFLLTGGDLPFFLALRDHGIQTVLARSERASAFMADAYSRLRREAAFVYGQFGPGAAVALSGLIDASFAKSNVVGLMSEARTDVRHRFAYQELDQVSMAAPFVKWAARVERADRAPDMLRTAVYESIVGSPGPTYLGVPNDIFLATIEDAVVPSLADLAGDNPPYRTKSSTSDVEAAVAEIEGAQRPILLAGTGTVISAAWSEVQTFVEANRIPAVTSVGGKGAISENHPMAHGVVGRYSRKSANQILREADLVIAIGTRLGDMTTNRGQAIHPDAKIIQADIDPSALGRNYAADVALVGDARMVLHDLNEGLSSLAMDPDWPGACRSLTEGWLADRERVETQLPASPISPVSVMAAMRQVLNPTDIVVTDTGYMAAWTSTLYDIRQAGLTHLRTAGSLGWAVPASLGAQLAMPDRRTVCVTGDGGIGYHISELETAVRLGLPVVFLLLNNGCLAFEYQAQRLLLGDVEPTLNDFTDTDYAGVARGFGAYGTRVTEASQLERALRSALDRGEPALIDVVIDREAVAPVTSYDRVIERVL